tara:strand:+ start:48 stop:485 length:438 start_codon:yes stop_codon:yes gene_type:complete
MIRKKLRIKEIEDKLSSISDSISLVEDNFPDNFDSFSNLGLVKDGIYKKVEFAIESIIDICNIINSDLRLGSPETEDSILSHLESKKILDKKVIDLIREMKGFRNILVHKYGDIDEKVSYDSIKTGLKDFEVILKEIEGFLEKQR